MIGIEEEYIELYKSVLSRMNASCGDILNKYRPDAFEKFKKTGFPSVSDDKYRNIDLSSALSVDYGLNIIRKEIPVSSGCLFDCDVNNLSTNRLYVVNDSLYEDPQILPVLKSRDVVFGSLNTFSKKKPEILEQYYNKLAGESSEGMTNFNTSFAQDGFVLYVPDGVEIEKPIQIIQALSGDEDIMVHRRILIILGKRARVKVLLCDHTISNKRFFANQVAEIFLNEESSLEYYDLEVSSNDTTRFSNTYMSLDKSSSLFVNGFTIKNGITKNNVVVSFKGEHASADVSALVLGGKNQVIDNDIFVDHAVPNCYSNQLFKYVLDDNAKGVFDGKIFVRKDSQKTEAYQSNKNLCSTGKAKMISKPQLEIYADDVKCNHGSATGQLDDESLFYLRSRGISEKEAKLLLKFAFASDVLAKIRIEPIKERISDLVNKRFRGIIR